MRTERVLPLERRCRVLLERRGRGKLVARVLDLDALAGAELRDGCCEVGVANGMQRVRGDRAQAPRELVQALRAALEAMDAPFDAELDRLVIARFEMQAGDVFGHAPVAAPQRFIRVDV